MRFFRNLLLYVTMLMAFTTEEPIDKIIAAFKKYTDELPQEKIYLHLDQPYYAPGDRIWLKVYLVGGPQHIPSPISRSIFIELFDSKKKLVEQVKLYNLNGAAAGNFVLHDSLQAGDYMIRAYTPWMKNFSEDYFFYRTIKIYNYNDETSVVKTDNTTDVQFFPEGGEWVSGFTSKLAFKAVDKHGLGKKISGKILDETGQLITPFQSNFLGMGYCEMVPDQRHVYHAVLDESLAEVKLPQVQASGITMSVTNRSDKDVVVVRIQNNTEEKTVYLIAQTRGVICHVAKIALPNIISFVKIPKEDLMSGVVQITVVSEAGVPHAERLIFIDHDEKLTIKAKPDKEIYAPREKVTVQIQVLDLDGDPVAGDFSLAITDDEQILSDNNRENIYSYLFFASDLKGPIESSGYYFNPENADRLEALDALLMTQGWRRFVYAKVMDGSWPILSFQPQQGLTIKGKMIDQSTKKPAARGTVSYLRTFPFPEIKKAVTNETGDFELSNVLYFDSTNVMLQGETRRGEKAVKFIIDSLADLSPADFSFVPMRIHNEVVASSFVKESKDRKKINQAYNYSDNSIMLEAIEVKGKKEEPTSTNAILKRTYGPSSASLQVAGNPNLEFLQHPLLLLQGRIAGVQVTGTDNNWNISIRGVNSIRSGTTPLILVNNMPYDINDLNMINVRDIESVAVYKGADAAMFGVRGTNGVIVFYLKSGGSRVRSAQSPYSFHLGAFQTYRQFYSPRYDVQKPEHVKPDRRTVLLWEPFINTDSTGKATVTFYNHDLTTTVTGVIEGMTAEGNVGYQAFHYAIKK